MKHEVVMNGETYVIERVEIDDCVVTLNGKAVDDTVAMNVYMTALLQYLPTKEQAMKFEFGYSYRDDEGYETRDTYEQKATSWAQIGAAVDDFETKSILGSEVRSVTRLE